MLVMPLSLFSDHRVMYFKVGNWKNEKYKEKLIANHSCSVSLFFTFKCLLKSFIYLWE